LDKRKIIPGDNLRKSIFREGLDKADVALIFFTANSLKSSWVDREIKHVLREERSKGNDFDLNKIISIFDSDETYRVISERYPELTDDLLHLMPVGYSPIQLGQLISAIWSKYLSLQGGDVATQRQLLEKDREIFRKDQSLQELSTQLEKTRSERSKGIPDEEFRAIFESGAVSQFVAQRQSILTEAYLQFNQVPNASEARAFGLIEPQSKNPELVLVTEKGRNFFKWLILHSSQAK
jgi:hypothetical protein